MSMTQAGVNVIQVLIVGEVNVVTSRVMVRDQFNTEYEVTAAYLPKASGIPQPGENWLIEKKYGRWVLTTLVGYEDPIEVTGDQSTDVSSILYQILNALAARGILVNGTIPLPVTPPPDEETDPEPEPTPDNFDEEYDSEEWIEENDEVFVEPLPEDPADHGHEHNRPPPHNRFSFLTLGTYNVFFGLGPARVREDLNRLRDTRVDVFCLQECDSPNRDALFTDIDSSPNWDVWQPGVRGTGHVVGSSPRELPIIYNVDEVTFLTGGSGQLAPTIPGQAGRYVVWARFKHDESGMRFTVFNVHLGVFAIRKGVWNDAEYPGRVAQYKQCLDTLVPMLVDAKQHGPVYLFGDFNYHWERVVEVGRVPGSPKDRLNAIGMVNNWGVMGMTTGPTRKGSGWIDYCWYWIDAAGGVLLTWQKVLPGYQSDHNPVLVTFRIKSRIKHKHAGHKGKPPQTHHGHEGGGGGGGGHHGGGGGGHGGGGHGGGGHGGGGHH